MVLAKPREGSRPKGIFPDSTLTVKSTFALAPRKELSR